MTAVPRIDFYHLASALYPTTSIELMTSTEKLRVFDNLQFDAVLHCLGCHIERNKNARVA